MEFRGIVGTNGEVLHQVTLHRNGRITLPAEARRQASASEGDVFLAEGRNADEIVLRKNKLVDASQSYFVRGLRT